MERRRFLRTTAVSIVGAGVAAGCGGDDGAGVDVPDTGRDLGTPDEVRAKVADGGGVWEVSDARAYVVEVPEEHRATLAAAVDETIRPGVEAGFLAMGERCPHQGCRVPWCESSGWFECPCHGSRFSTFGELRRGPSNGGMFQLPLEVSDDTVRLLPGSVEGPDSDVTGLDDPGDHCV